MRPESRRGVALIVTLWVLATASGLALNAAASEREHRAASRNRWSKEQARWDAQACSRQIVAAMEGVLTSARDRRDQSLRWIEMPSWLGHELRRVGSCQVKLEARGARLPVWRMREAWMKESVARALGVEVNSAGVRALVSAVSADSTVTIGELQRELPKSLDWRRLENLLANDDAAVGLNAAPPAVLVALPGMTPKAVQAIERRRQGGDPVVDLHDLLRELDGDAAARLTSKFAEVSVATTAEPTGWEILVELSAGTPAVHASMRTVIARVGAKVSIVRVEVR